MEQAIFNHAKHASRLLDFGAGDKRLKGNFWQLASRAGTKRSTYPRRMNTNIRSISQVIGPFDAIMCLEVIEHMSLNDYVDLMDEFERLIDPQARLIIGTPNPLCVVPMWAGDPGHVQQFPVGGPGGGFRRARLRRRSLSRALWRLAEGSSWLRFLAMRILCYLLSVDYAHGLVVIGKRKTAEVPSSFGKNDFWASFQPRR